MKVVSCPGCIASPVPSARLAAIRVMTISRSALLRHSWRSGVLVLAQAVGAPSHAPMTKSAQEPPNGPAAPRTSAPLARLGLLHGGIFPPRDVAAARRLGVFAHVVRLALRDGGSARTEFDGSGRFVQRFGGATQVFRVRSVRRHVILAAEFSMPTPKAVGQWSDRSGSMTDQFGRTNVLKRRSKPAVSSENQVWPALSALETNPPPG